MTNRFEIRVLLTAILFLIPITAGLTTYVLLEVKEDTLLSTSTNAYSPPKNIGGLVESVSESLVTINCQDVLGSGFSFGLDSYDLDNGFKFRSPAAQSAPSTIVTNHHVLENCLTTNKVQVIGFGGKKYAGEILEVDEVNDLALVRIESEMALGSPHGLGGSVTFGNIINFDSPLVFHSASLSPGNSGGPLVENVGWVYGVNTGSKPIGQNFNISVGVNAFCDRLIICEKRKYWVDE